MKNPTYDANAVKEFIFLHAFLNAFLGAGPSTVEAVANSGETPSVVNASTTTTEHSVIV